MYSIPFSWLNNIILTYHFFVYQSSVDGHFTFYFLATINIGAVNIMYKFLYGCMFSFFLGVYFVVEFLNYMVSLYFYVCVYKSILNLLRFSRMTVPFYILTRYMKIPILCQPLLLCLDYSHPSGCEVVSLYIDFFNHEYIVRKFWQRCRRMCACV